MRNLLSILGALIAWGVLSACLHLLVPALRDVSIIQSVLLSLAIWLFFALITRFLYERRESIRRFSERQEVEGKELYDRTMNDLKARDKAPK